MRRYVVVLAVAVAAVLGAASVSEQFADAGSRKKIHFTQTFDSYEDPGGDGQIALLLPPSEGAIYHGSATYAASGPVTPVILHEIGAGDAAGQPVWSADGMARYAMSELETSGSDSVVFTGAALALRSGEEFVATASVDVWTRGQPAEILVQKTKAEPPAPESLLARATVPATLPMHAGMHGGGDVLYVITDASDAEYAEGVSELQGWQVGLAEIFAGPGAITQKLYLFRNGVEGPGIYGFQADLFSAVPGQDGYSPLSSIVEVGWKPGQKEMVFESEADVLAAGKGGRIILEETGVILHAPHMVWPGGQMQVRASNSTDGGLPYDGGQVTEIDMDAMEATFVARRGWGPDGRTTYCITTGAAPPEVAEVMGVAPSPAQPGAPELFHFKNGIKGPGPLGFQPGISSAVPGDDGYSPVWSVRLVEWNEPDSARILETRADIDAFRDMDALLVYASRPLNTDHTVDCPVIDPFQ